MAGERTVNPYATYGPAGTGDSWGEYFRSLRAARFGTEPDSERGEGDGGDLRGVRSVERLGSGDWPNGEHEPRSLIAFQKLLISAGFTTKGVYATDLEAGGVFGKNTKQEGNTKPDRLLTTIVLYAWKQPRWKCWIGFEQVNGGSWKCWGRQTNASMYNIGDKELKDWIRGAAT